MTQEDKGREGVWGPEIRVDGVRPEWLEASLNIPITNGLGEWRYPDEDEDDFDGNNVTWAWRNIGHIRLPADHPHYAKGLDTTDTLSPTPPQGIAPEVVERALALVKRMGGEMQPGAHYVSQIEPMRAEARAIVALLPAEVDGDLIAAREADASASEANGFHEYAAKVRAGEDDNGPVRHRYEGIKLGRSLASGEG